MKELAMYDEKAQGTVGAWIFKGAVAIVPACLLVRVFQSHAAIAFSVGLFAGIISQHFIPPRGTIKHLFLLLAVAGAGIIWIAWLR